VPQELTRLLGLPDDAGAELLRRTYEQQMAQATRAHDHRRALELSAAFDALPQARRHAVYPHLDTRFPTALANAGRSRSRLRPGRRPAPAPSPWDDPPRRPGRSATAGRTTRGRHLARRVFVLVVVVVAVAAFVYWRLHRPDGYGSAAGRPAAPTSVGSWTPAVHDPTSPPGAAPRRH
jgi:hypothetical protein